MTEHKTRTSAWGHWWANGGAIVLVGNSASSVTIQQTRHVCPILVLKLAHRLRRWSNIEAMGHCLVFDVNDHSDLLSIRPAVAILYCTVYISGQPRSLNQLSSMGYLESHLTLRWIFFK